jgi:hypothetical protein
VIKAIETIYAGHRFRSRLEARWAVFFDTMGIRWLYENQGYQLEDRLGVLDEPAPINYLPDFWLPEFSLHAEVKGSLTDEELARTLTIAAALSSPTGGCGSGQDSLILGPIPEPNRRSSYPYRLHLHKGDLMATPFWADRKYQADGSACFAYVKGAGRPTTTIGNDAGEIRITGDWLLSGHPDKVGDRWANGYRAARSARFEHGERR